MAKPSLQVKNVASLLLAAGASAASGLAWRRLLDASSKWQLPMCVLAICLLCQLGLVFVESKEEEELSLTRKRRMDLERQEMQINATLASKMDEALQVNDLDQYTRLRALRRD